MPPNMKMPIIKVTPSSPSPDPNHPDYPEFFEDKLYLEHQASAASQSVVNQVSLDSFSLVLQEESKDDDVEMIENVKLYPQRSSLKMRRQNSLLQSNSEPHHEKNWKNIVTLKYKIVLFLFPREEDFCSPSLIIKMVIVG